MKDQIASVQAAALDRIAGITDMKGLEDARVGILGKKGTLTQVQQGMRNVPKEDKPAVGAMLNEARAIIT
ncbi:MAG: phenylalanine--tRNA ligase subunit alpha, partial [Akkermansia sp.]|nr:phenylalanine--tRNA ligase subunit alpha [Akkermansia sp.]